MPVLLFAERATPVQLIGLSSDVRFITASNSRMGGLLSTLNAGADALVKTRTRALLAAALALYLYLRRHGRKLGGVLFYKAIRAFMIAPPPRPFMLEDAPPAPDYDAADKRSAWHAYPGIWTEAELVPTGHEPVPEAEVRSEERVEES